MRKVKEDAFTEEGSALGHNSGANDKNLIAHVEFVAREMDKIDAIRGKIKDRLDKAKTDGFLKTSIRNAIKVLRMTEEQIQAKEEIDSETARITELCADLPLFHAAEEAA